ncbi:MAG: hypothetical protein AB1611_16230 [bacterium]
MHSRILVKLIALLFPPLARPGKAAIRQINVRLLTTVRLFI